MNQHIISTSTLYVYMCTQFALLLLVTCTCTWKHTSAVRGHTPLNPRPVLVPAHGHVTTDTRLFVFTVCLCGFLLQDVYDCCVYGRGVSIVLSSGPSRESLASPSTLDGLHYCMANGAFQSCAWLGAGVQLCAAQALAKQLASLISQLLSSRGMCIATWGKHSLDICY